jgi:Tfp pilus assembly protein PilV
MVFPSLHTETPSCAHPRPAVAGRSATRVIMRTPRGFTLAEALIASVVLAVSILGIASALACSSQQSMATDEAAVTTALGKQLLEEIAAKPFPIPGVTTNPGWSSGSHDRSTYDDVADYDGYTDSTPITTLSGAIINPGPTYTRIVSFVQRINPSDTPGDGNFGLITVSVTGPLGATTRFSRIVANLTMVR